MVVIGWTLTPLLPSSRAMPAQGASWLTQPCELHVSQAAALVAHPVLGSLHEGDLWDVIETWATYPSIAEAWLQVRTALPIGSR